MKIIDRYTSAVHSSNLKSEPDTTYSDTDVLGAMGLAGRRNALAVALARLFAGDNTASRQIVEILAASAVGKAWHSERTALSHVEAQDISRAVLAWFRDGVCTPCGGHGFEVMGGEIGQGRAVLGEIRCHACRGTGKVPFDKQFPLDRLSLARWLVAEVEREQAMAGQAAMAMLAPRLNL